MGVGKVLPMSPPKAREFTPALSHGFNGAAMVLNDSVETRTLCLDLLINPANSDTENRIDLSTTRRHHYKKSKTNEMNFYTGRWSFGRKIHFLFSKV